LSASRFQGRRKPETQLHTSGSFSNIIMFYQIEKNDDGSFLLNPR